MAETPSNANIFSLIAQGMGPELHWYPESVGVSELASTLVAMANTGGGQVVLGVAPRAGKVQGISDLEAMIDKVFQAALMAEPVLVLPLPEARQAGGVQLLLLTVPNGLPHVYNFEGRYFGREEHHNVPIAARNLRELLVMRGVVQFELGMPPDASLEDLDQTQVLAYLKALNRSPDEDWREQLFQRGCLVKEGKHYLPTYAALLLFGKNPQRWLPNAGILAARFPGISYSDEYLKQDIVGTLPQQIRQADAFLRDNLRAVVRLVGLAHQETPEYPYEAVRELLVNAVAHRDYNLQGDNVHLHIFSDRLEVHSPGGLPGPVTVNNLLQARFSRNAVIVQVLSDLGYVERLGYGLNRVVTVMRQNGLRAPQFEETGGTFRVSLFGEAFHRTALPDMTSYSELELNPRQQLLLGFLGSNKRITNRDYQELCPDVHPETLRRDFADLVGRNVLIKMGSKRATYYILKEDG